MSPAGEAFAMLPPSVPRFWIWAAPIVAAASTSAGTCSRHSGERRISVYVVRAPSDERVAVDRDAAEGIDRPQVDDAGRRLAELAGQRDHQVACPTGDRAAAGGDPASAGGAPSARRSARDCEVARAR